MGDPSGVEGVWGLCKLGLVIREGMWGNDYCDWWFGVSNKGLPIPSLSNGTSQYATPSRLTRSVLRRSRKGSRTRAILGCLPISTASCYPREISVIHSPLIQPVSFDSSTLYSLVPPVGSWTACSTWVLVPPNIDRVWMSEGPFLQDWVSRIEYTFVGVAVELQYQLDSELMSLSPLIVFSCSLKYDCNLESYVVLIRLLFLLHPFHAWILYWLFQHRNFCSHSETFTVMRLESHKRTCYSYGVGHPLEKNELVGPDYSKSWRPLTGRSSSRDNVPSPTQRAPFFPY